MLLFPPSCGRLYVLRTRSSDSCFQNVRVLCCSGVELPQFHRTYTSRRLLISGAVLSTPLRCQRSPSPAVEPLIRRVGYSCVIDLFPASGRAIRHLIWSLKVEDAASQRSWTSSAPCFTHQPGFFEPYLSHGFSAKSRLVLASMLVWFTVLWATLIFSLSRRIFGDFSDDVEM